MSKNDNDPNRFTKQFLGSGQRRWILQNTSKTLGDMREYLDEVFDELAGFDEDDLICEHEGDLSVATTDYLNDWGPLVCERTGEPHTFAYRLGNVEEDLGFCEELIEETGASYSVKKLLGFAGPAAA